MNKIVTINAVKSCIQSECAAAVKRGMAVAEVKSAMLANYGTNGKIADATLRDQLTLWGYDVRPDADRDAVRSAENMHAAHDLVETALALGA